MDDRPWHLRERDEFEGIKRRLDVEFPFLHAGVADRQTVLRGELPIVADRRIIDQFEVEVLVVADGPRAVVPTVRETGGRIPHTVDRHVYPTTGNVCLFVKDEFWYRHPDGMDIVDFLNGPVTSFFVAQTYYELHGRWPFGERSHGAEGIREFYYELLGTRDKETVRRFLEGLAIAKLNGRAECPCMSGKRINACHGAEIRNLRLRIPRSSALVSLAALSTDG